MKTNIYSTEGKKVGQIELPILFTEEYRPDLIRRAFNASVSRKIQPWASDVMAGKRSTAESWDVGGGRARLPRVKAGPHRGGRGARGFRYRSKGRWFPAAGRAAIAPGTVKGRQAHPPKSEKILIKKINKKEMKKALKSAIAASINKELIEKRGHILEEIKSIPLIVEDKICDLKKTKEIESTLKNLGMEKELQRASVKKIRAGKGKTRGRKYKKRKSALIVVPKEKIKLINVFKNLSGIDIASADQLNISLLSPGGNAGRLVIWTKTSLQELESRFKIK